MKTDASTTHRFTVAETVAPEDLRVGGYVAVLTECVDFPSFFWADAAWTRRDEVVRIRFLPKSGGTPLKVMAICLPFVFVKAPNGKRNTLDIRRVQLVRLKKGYAKTAWRELGRRSRR